VRANNCRQQLSLTCTYSNHEQRDRRDRGFAMLQTRSHFCRCLMA